MVLRTWGKLLIIIICLFMSCSSENGKNNNVIVVKEENIVKKRLGVLGMSCVGCEVTLEEELSSIEGIVNVRASHVNDEVVVEFDSTRVNIDTIINVIKETGYEPHLAKNY